MTRDERWEDIGGRMIARPAGGGSRASGVLVGSEVMVDGVGGREVRIAQLSSVIFPINKTGAKLEDILNCIENR